MYSLGYIEMTLNSIGRKNRLTLIDEYGTITR